MSTLAIAIIADLLWVRPDIVERAAMARCARPFHPPGPWPISGIKPSRAIQLYRRLTPRNRPAVASPNRGAFVLPLKPHDSGDAVLPWTQSGGNRKIHRLYIVVHRGPATTRILAFDFDLLVYDGALYEVAERSYGRVMDCVLVIGSMEGQHEGNVLRSGLTVVIPSELI